MNHQERIKIAKSICKDLIKKGAEAVGIMGSVARKEDKKYSDLEMIAISTRGGERLFFTKSSMPILIEFHDPKNFLRMATTMKYDWPVVAGSFEILPLYDPSKIFDKGKRLRDSITDEMFRKGAKDALLDCLEYINKMKNAYKSKDVYRILYSSRIFAGSIASFMAFINKTYFKSENTVYEQSLIMKKKPKYFKQLFLLAGGYSTTDIQEVYKACIKLWKSCIEMSKKEGIKL